MPTLNHAEGELYYDVIDLTPAWVDDPPSVLFMHGLGFDGTIWADWLPAMAARFRLVTIDMRGCGRSSVPEAGYPWSFDGIAEDILAVSDAAGCGDRIHFVGESLGGIMGYHLAIHHPDRLHTVVSINASHQGGWIGGNVGDWDRVMQTEGIEAWSRSMMEFRFGAGVISDAHYAYLDGLQTRSARHVILEVSGELLRKMDLKPRLASISTPLLLLMGEASPFVSVECACDIRSAVGGAAQLHVIAGARHGVAISHSRECIGATLAFIGRHCET